MRPAASIIACRGKNRKPECHPAKVRLAIPVRAVYNVSINTGQEGQPKMKLQYLGTAAAEGIPGMFCQCALCRQARKLGGKNIRTRSQALLDDTVLIDFPADTYAHVLRFGIELDKLHTLIITHAHMDHLYERDFWCRNPGIANDIAPEPLHVYLTAAGYEQCRQTMQKEHIPAERVMLHRIAPYVPFEAEGYRFTPLKADHAADADPVIYIIEHAGQCMLYAHDTGYFPDETWDYLAHWGGRFDFVSLDCTGGIQPYRRGHMGFAVCDEVFRRLTAMGLCTAQTPVCMNHFSHNGALPADEMDAEAAKHGFLASYDGMVVSF